MTSPRPLHIALAGMVSLAVAMGIGRFAFTPILPMMLAERTLDIAGASWLASANYFGYLVGALVCTFQPWLWGRFGWHAPLNGPAIVRGGLVATAVLTAAMCAPIPAAWPTLRFAAGVASAFAFVYTSGWCLSTLAALGKPAMGGVIYTGPGVGITFGGLAASALVLLHWQAATAWLAFGVLAFAGLAMVWRVFDPASVPRGAIPAASGAGAAAPAASSATQMGLLAFAYGLAGFGYIITATFLPVIARQSLPASPWLDMFWPIFGAGVVLGALFASRIRAAGDMRLRLVICYVVQAAGILLTLAMPTLLGFAFGSLLLGLPFTAITFFGLQEVRRLKPAQAPAYIGLVSVMYGLGQIVGPPLAAALVARSATPAAGFTLSLAIAAASLVFGAAIYALMAKLFPLAPAATASTAR